MSVDDPEILCVLDEMCVCCLRKDVPFINLTKCKHGGIFGQVFHYKTIYPLKLICYLCHSMLVKISEFKKQVENSIIWLNSGLKYNKKSRKKDKNIKNTKPLFSFERTPIEINCSPDANPTNDMTVKDEVSNQTEVWPDQSTIQDEEIWTAEQPLADEWPEKANEDEDLTTHEEVNIPVDIKMELDESSDQEDDVPLSETRKERQNEPAKSRESTKKVDDSNAETSQGSKHKTLEDKYTGKIITVSLTKEAYLLEREQERAKESYTKLPFRCDHCVVGFDHEVTLQEHMEKRHSRKEGSLLCKLCRSVLSTQYSFKEHMRRHFKRYECCECCKRYSTLHAAVEHYKEQHGAIATAFTCECGFVTDSNRRYRYHRDKHKEKPQCTTCGKTFVNNSGLKVHVLTQHKKNKHKYACTFDGCSKYFFAKSGMRAHLSSHSSTGAFCETCHTHFKCATTLRHHLMTHSAHLSRNDWKYVCDECGEKFLLKSSLQEHIDWAHLHKATHRCDRCSKVYKNARGLQRHTEFVHDKKRPPKDKICDHCGRGFTTLSILRTHIRTHTGERPLSCARCSATFAHPGALYTHNKLLHAHTAPA